MVHWVVSRADRGDSFARGRRLAMSGDILDYHNSVARLEPRDGGQI